MKLSSQHAGDLAARILVRHGWHDLEAVTLSKLLVEAELRGRATHGLLRIPGIVRYAQVHPSRNPRILQETAALVYLDGGEQIGYLVAHQCAELAIQKASQQGVCLAGARNIGHTGMLGTYVLLAAEAGFVAMAASDCSPMVAPWGGAQKLLGTNPIAFAFPADPPIVIDMSTSAATMGDVLKAQREGNQLEPGTAINAAGQPTEDPSEAREGALLPFGQHKGYGLGLAVQLLAGAFVGAAPVPHRGRDYGFFFLAMKKSLFTSEDFYDHAVTELVARIKATERMDGIDEILVPGERSFREKETRQREGIDIDDQLLAELQQLVAG